MKQLAHYWRQRVWLDYAYLAALLTVFLGLALHSISRWSIWFDEGFGIYLTKFNILDIAHYTGRDVHPPFYYVVLKGWEMCFGTSELAVRSLSVLFAMIAIGFGFFIIRRLFGRRAAILSLPILVLAPMTVRYAQEARMYTMAMAICAAATYILIHLHPTPPADKRKANRLWLIYALLVAAGLWTHYFTSLIWIVHWVWRYVTLRQENKATTMRRFWAREWVRSYLIAGILFLPWIPALIHQFNGIQDGFWIGPVNVGRVMDVFSNALVYQASWRLKEWTAMLFLAVCVLLIVLGVRLYRQLPAIRRPGYLLLCLYAFLPIVVLAALSLPPLRPIMVERYFSHTLLGLYMLCGVIITLYAWPRRAKLWRSLSYIGLLITLGFGVTNVYTLGNFNNYTLGQPSAKQAMQLVAQHAMGHEPVIVQGAYAFYEVVYYQTAEHQVYIFDGAHNFRGNVTAMIRDHEPHKVKDLKAFAQAHPFVWFIGGKNDAAIQSLFPDWRIVESFQVNLQHGSHVTLFATQP